MSQKPLSLSIQLPSAIDSDHPKLLGPYSFAWDIIEDSAMDYEIVAPNTDAQGGW